MLLMNQIAPSKRQLFRMLPCLLGALAFGNAIGAGQAEAAATGAPAFHPDPLPKAYRVVNLPPGVGIGSTTNFNAKDQIAFRAGPDPASAPHAYFYDGTRSYDIGSLGGTRSVPTDLNDAGEVVGASAVAGGLADHAFKWSRRSGMRDLGLPAGFVNAGATAINNRGEVAGNLGSTNGQPGAFRWSAAEGLEQLEGLTGNRAAEAFAADINDAGTIAGFGFLSNRNTHAAIWKRKTGIVDIGTLGGANSGAFGVSEDGIVFGYSQTATDPRGRVFAWTQKSGITNISTFGGRDVFPAEQPLSPDGTFLVGYIVGDGFDSAALWRRGVGWTALGSLPAGPGSTAAGVNNKGQVVGWANGGTETHGFVWSAREGMIDLNTRLRHAPPGLVIAGAWKISDNGSIFAFAISGASGSMVLLKPDCGDRGVHTVAPINAPDIVEAGASFDASVNFADDDTAAQHHIFWNWGDGSGDQQGNTRERNGAGSAAASYRYLTPGVHTLTAKVGNRAGQTVSVSRTIVVYERAAGAAGGAGWFMSPLNANPKAGGQANWAVFSFYSPGATGLRSTAAKARLQFQAGLLNFYSESVKPAALQGARGQFEGSGKLNGVDGYRFRLSAAAGSAGSADQPGRFGLKIWHVDSATHAEVVDYDNLGTGSGSAVPAAQGSIVMQP